MLYNIIKAINEGGSNNFLLEKNMKKLNINDITPLYIQIMEEIENQIKSKKLLPGEKLKPETELAKEYGVSLITVRNAISNLIKKGLVTRKQGKGTFVIQQKFNKNINNLQGFSDLCYQIGATPGAITLENNLITPSESILTKLNLSINDKVIYISRLRLANNEPVVIEKNYFSIKYISLLQENLNNSSLFKILKEKLNVQVASSIKKIEICKATKEEAELLKIKKNTPLLFIKSTTFDEKNNPLYVGIQIINADCFSFYVYEGETT